MIQEEFIVCKKTLKLESHFKKEDALNSAKRLAKNDPKNDFRVMRIVIASDYIYSSKYNNVSELEV